MATLVFYFEDSTFDVYSGKVVDLSAWNHACKVADIKNAIIINKSSQNITTFDADMDIQIVEEIPLFEGNVTQLVTPTEISEATSLYDFNHETDYYVIGPASGWKGNYFSDNYIFIPQHTTAAAYGLIAGSVVMYDRFRRLWQ